MASFGRENHQKNHQKICLKICQKKFIKKKSSKRRQKMEPQGTNPKEKTPSNPSNTKLGQIIAKKSSRRIWVLRSSSRPASGQRA